MRLLMTVRIQNDCFENACHNQCHFSKDGQINILIENMNKVVLSHKKTW